MTTKERAVTCLRCGTCCLANFIAFVTDEDLSRWRQEGRQDILQVIEHDHMMWVGDRILSVEDGHYAQGCPFLVFEEGLWRCTIYETRPRVCRDYQPGSSAICPQWAAEFVVDKTG